MGRVLFAARLGFAEIWLRGTGFVPLLASVGDQL